VILRVLLANLIAGPALGASLSVDVTGGIPEKGQLLVSLFSSENDWMKAPMHEAVVPVGVDGRAEFVIEGLEPGAYGLSLIYDEDNNYELDLNLLGIPTEGFGFSNNARATFGPPDWGEVKFRVESGENELHLRLDRAD